MRFLWTFMWCVWQSCFRRKADVQPGNGQRKEGALATIANKRTRITTFLRDRSGAPFLPHLIFYKNKIGKKKKKKWLNLTHFLSIVNTHISQSLRQWMAHWEVVITVVSQVVTLYRVLPVEGGIAVWVKRSEPDSLPHSSLKWLSKQPLRAYLQPQRHTYLSRSTNG